MAKGTETFKLPNDLLMSRVVIRSDAAPGMSLRDYFAGQMMAAIVGADAKALDHPGFTANDAVMMADALLNALGKGGAA